MAAIKVDELHHTYDDRGRAVTAVDHISFEVEENEFYTLLGPSGCGKTTTLRCLAGLEVPTSGTIEMDDVVVFSSRGVVPTHRRDIGMVFQDYAVWPHMSVFDNVAFPLHTGKRLSSSVIKDRVHEALELVNMAEYVDRKATQLSGGQQQRLSLARALVRQPKVLLLDEPLSNLDAKLREQMRKELRFLQRRVKVTTIFVTHDQVEALSMSNRIAVMNKGVIVQVGTPREIYQAPHSEFVAAFVGATSFVSGKVASVDAAAKRVLLDTQVGMLVSDMHIELGVGDLISLAIRPEAMQLSTEPFPGPNNLEGVVDIGLFVGDAVDYHVHVGGELLRVKGSPHSRYRRRDKVFVDVPPAECVLIRRADESAAELARPEDTLEPVMIDTTA
jgi:iron(III) transport system ATP-binding protein